MSNNKAIAGCFYQLAAFMAEKEEPFKARAYRRAAQVIEELEKDVSTLGGVSDLKKLPAIGEATAKKILEYLDTGKMEALEKFKRVEGGIATELLDIEGLGPKRVRLIQSELDITTIEQLVAAAKAGKLRQLERFDELLEKKILDFALHVDERTKRFDRAEVTGDVELLKKTIGSIHGVQRCEVAGSYRREKETVGDIDILAISDTPAVIADAVAKLDVVRNVVAHGDTKVSFDLHNGLRVDVRFVIPEQWGAALLYFTGSKEHNIAMRKVAIQKGWKLNEYGLYNGEEVVAQETEPEIYDALGLRFYEPTERASGL